MSEQSYTHELYRLQSFDQNWPIPFVDTSKMARTGLYALGAGDMVRCFSCEISLANWLPTDDVHGAGS